jgi:hypothetical protein
MTTDITDMMTTLDERAFAHAVTTGLMTTARAFAHAVLDHDINPDDRYQVGRFLRKRNPRVSQRDIDECVKEARKLRDGDEQIEMFNTIDQKVEAWPKSRTGDDDLAEYVRTYAQDIIHRLARKYDDPDWQVDGAIEIRAARYAALLLIKQAAWHKHKAELLEVTAREYEVSDE